MSFTEIIKNSVLEEFSGGLTVDKVLVSIGISLLLSVFLVVIYKITYRGVSFNTSYVFSLFLLSLITTVMILTITSNIVLSLGMVGALSIVRFRTAVKDPVDTAFMYWYHHGCRVLFRFRLGKSCSRLPLSYHYICLEKG